MAPGQKIKTFLIAIRRPSRRSVIVPSSASTSHVVSDQDVFVLRQLLRLVVGAWALLSEDEVARRFENAPQPAAHPRRKRVVALHLCQGGPRPRSFHGLCVCGVSVVVLPAAALVVRRRRPGLDGSTCCGRRSAAGALGSARVAGANPTSGSTIFSDHLVEAKVSVLRKRGEGKKTTGAAFFPKGNRLTTPKQAAPPRAPPTPQQLSWQ